MSTIEKVEADFQTYISQSRYARWLEEKSRRETWSETVQRYCDFFSTKYPEHKKFLDTEVYPAIFNKEVMPSMRCLMTAGKALERDNMAGFNCTYTAIDDVRAFDEILYILSCGSGVGFSVERQFVNKLPVVAEEFHDTETILKIRDSRIGWASGYRELISLLYSGQVPKWDLSSLRPAGARLKTFGGRSSGPQPLHDLFVFTCGVFERARGRKLNSLECHDIICKIADTIVVGGVRRSALISLSNLTDERMRNAKNGQWWETQPQRTLANNSVAYTEKPDAGIFLKEWATLYESKSGERGLFNRQGAQKNAAFIGRDPTYEFGTNPCGEIVLRSNQGCNLSECVIRSTDTEDSIRKKLKIATILGTFQATLTDFRYVRSVWKKNMEEEALLGVSLTGIMDNPLFNKNPSPEFLLSLKGVVKETNKEWAKKLGINPAAACTTIKPSGTVSQLVGSASGIHPRYSRYYVRTVRSDNKDPLGLFLKDQKVPCDPDAYRPDSTLVFSFPIQSPETSLFRNDLTAIEQLEHYLIFKEYWCDHNPSITVYVREHEWLTVGAWIYDHFDDIGGISLLPYSDHVYKQPPYTEIKEQEYLKLVNDFPEIDWGSFKEKEDTTVGTKELACVSGYCEIL